MQRREPCETCVALTKMRPTRTIKIGRQRGDGRWFCADHGVSQVVPDPTRTAVGLQRKGYLRAVQDAAAAALRLDVPAAELRKALEDTLARFDPATS